MPLHIKPILNEIRRTGLRDREDKEPRNTQQNLTERFSQSKHLEELHKHQEGEKKGEYLDFRLSQFRKLHEVLRKAKEDTEASGTRILDDLYRGCLYRAGSKTAHFIVESSRATTGFASCCLDHKQPLMWRFEDVVLRHNQLAYILFPPMIPLVRAVMTVNTSTSTSTAATATTSEVPPRDSSTSPSPLSPLLHFYSCSQTTFPLPTPRMVLPHLLQMLHRYCYRVVMFIEKFVQNFKMFPTKRYCR
ncbi:hypothetical protein M9H77_28366 [Catharanthus roseus]|uniref:Uncharacterized protein n=1 Tax=Catharanthus roseus TaxID=4058 RepID=A0ACC0AJF3_CATRO|nr:hypothetical protein M9H77_28366 [Catharanthus roseus]